MVLLPEGDVYYRPHDPRKTPPAALDPASPRLQGQGAQGQQAAKEHGRLLGGIIGQDTRTVGQGGVAWDSGELANAHPRPAHRTRLNKCAWS